MRYLIKQLITVSTTVLAFGIFADAQTNEKNKQTIEDVCNFLQQCGTYYLATVENEQPRVRPFGTAAIYENRLYIQTGKRKNVAKQMAANPRVEICAYDQPKGEWIRIEAFVVPDERIEAKQFMLDQYPALKPMYSATDDNTLVLYLSDITATFYSFEKEPKIIKF